MADGPYEGALIDGRRTSGGETAPIINPATGAVLARVAQAGPKEVEAAVGAAQRTWDAGDWRRASSAERARVLLRLAALIREHQDELARLESQNVGKPMSESHGEIGMGADCFQYYAGLVPHFGGQTIPVAAKGTGLTFREPLGVCALIVPWNFPFAITTWKVAPALAMGNSVIVKPASATPLTALRLGELALEAGLPPGVLNVLPGAGGAIGGALVRHPAVRKIGFTGSTEIGAGIMAQAAAGIKRVSLELGGKSASIVFADADIEQAAGSIWSVFGNAGQDCCARSRLLVERSVYAEVVERFVERTRQIRMGDPLDPATELGPLISAAHREKVDRYVKNGVAEGARLCIGGTIPGDDRYARGSFYMPAVFDNATPAMEIVRDEIFGPVVAIMPFDSEAEAIKLANDTIYGLSGSIWTRDIGRALRVAKGVETGVLSINSSSSVHLEMPFGGFKQSGIGRELGPAALEHYSEVKSVFIADN